MRLLLLHNRIYRAFPELDRYSDERCLKFMRVAQRGWMRRLFHITIILLAAALALFAGVAATGWIAETWFRGLAARSSILFDLSLVLLGVCLSPVAGYLTRDLLLRSRIRHVLRARGTCFRCRYSLIGLPVGPGHTVTCPECAQETEVDPALGELVLDDSGLARFQPPPPRLPLIFTPARVRTLKRIAIVLALILGVGVPTILGGYELWLRHQATIAAAEKPGAQALVALAEANQPPGSDGGANAWEILREVLELQGQVDFADEQAHPPAPGERLYADFSQIYLGPWASESDEAWLQYKSWADAGRRRLEAYGPAGVYAALDRMAAAPRSVRPMTLSQDEPVWRLGWEYAREVRQISQANAARMKRAQDDGDLAAFASATEANLALVRIAMHQPSATDSLVGLSIEALTFQRLQTLLASHPPVEWLDAIDAAIARQRSTLPPTFRWECERLSALDTLAWVFMDPARVRWGRKSAEVKAMLYQEDERALGTYAANRDALNAIYQEVKAFAALPRWQRPAIPKSRADLPPIIRSTTSDPQELMISIDRAELVRAAYSIQSALERHFAAHGAYPDSLAALVPSYLPAPPIDPWTGMPWGYRLRSPEAPAADPREYVLYSFGEDRIDNGGSPTPGYTNLKALTESGAGADYIINEWQPRE